VIGLTVSRTGDDGKLRDGVSVAYIDAVVEAGGLPVLLPNSGQAEVLNRLDGLILTGGGDFDPKWYAQPNLGTPPEAISAVRDQAEIQIIRAAMHLKLPMVGICRGIQGLAVALGGTLIQDIGRQRPHSEVCHYQTEGREIVTHSITVDLPSQLFGILAARSLSVNSFHHQAVEMVPPGWRAVAWSDDGVIEAMEWSGTHFAIGVQWHPEDLAAGGDLSGARIFAELIAQGEKFRGTAEER